VAIGPKNHMMSAYATQPGMFGLFPVCPLYQNSTVADNCETRAQFGITIVLVGVEMDHSSGPERGREATEATLNPVEQLHWVRHGNEYEKAVLSGDPEQPGSFYVMRYHVLIACDVPPHWHPEDEHATVISGEISLALGEKFLADALRPLTAGSYALIPRRQPHFTRYTAGSIVQVHGLGPLVVYFLES
jgi:hypothetical protein